MRVGGSHASLPCKDGVTRTVGARTHHQNGSKESYGRCTNLSTVHTDGLPSLSGKDKRLPVFTDWAVSLRHSRRRKDNNPPGDRGPVFPYGQTLRNRAVRGLRRDAPSGASVSRSVSGNVTSFSQPLSEYRCCCTSVCYSGNIERMMQIE